MKKSKLLSLLLLPVMAAGTLVGCGGKSNPADVYALYNTMQSKYATLESEINAPAKDTYKNRTFANASSNIYAVVKGATTYELKYAVDIKYNVEGISSTLFDNIASGQTEVNGLAKGESVYNRYYAIVKIQDAVVKGVYNYYDRHANDFYTSIAKIKKVDKDDIKALYKKAETLNDATSTFVNNKNRFENLIQTFGFNDVHAFVATSFSKSYNDFIQKSLDFVEYFKDLHIKYVYGKDVYTEKDSPARIKDEMILNVAKVLYYEDLKSFNYTNCDLNDLALDMVDNYATNYYALILKLYLEKTNEYSASTVPFAFESSYSITSSWISATLKRTIGSFNQKIDLYEKMYNSVDFYNYNYARTNYNKDVTNRDKFIATQSDEMKARYEFLDDFYFYTFAPYANFIIPYIA